MAAKKYGEWLVLVFVATGLFAEGPCGGDVYGAGEYFALTDEVVIGLQR
jgi:hypothetical protein